MVKSSRVALKASAALSPDGLFLLAPAVYVGLYSEEAPTPRASVCSVVHGWKDKVVSVDKVLRFARDHSLQLNLLDSGHRLNDQLPILETLFAHFLASLNTTPKEDPRSGWEREQESIFQCQSFFKQKPRIPR